MDFEVTQVDATLDRCAAAPRKSAAHATYAATVSYYTDSRDMGDSPRNPVPSSATLLRDFRELSRCSPAYGSITSAPHASEPNDALKKRCRQHLHQAILSLLRAIDAGRQVDQLDIELPQSAIETARQIDRKRITGRYMLHSYTPIGEFRAELAISAQWVLFEASPYDFIAHWLKQRCDKHRAATTKNRQIGRKSHSGKPVKNEGSAQLDRITTEKTRNTTERTDGTWAQRSRLWCPLGLPGGDRVLRFVTDPTARAEFGLMFARVASKDPAKVAAMVGWPELCALPLKGVTGSSLGQALGNVGPAKLQGDAFLQLLRSLSNSDRDATHLWTVNSLEQHVRRARHLYTACVSFVRWHDDFCSRHYVRPYPTEDEAREGFRTDLFQAPESGQKSSPRFSEQDFLKARTLLQDRYQPRGLEDSQHTYDMGY